MMGVNFAPELSDVVVGRPTRRRIERLLGIADVRADLPAEDPVREAHIAKHDRHDHGGPHAYEGEGGWWSHRRPQGRVVRHRIGPETDAQPEKSPKKQRNPENRSPA